ncbi:carboxymuconolactone decarboxylase family protein [Bradyrhizobium prioriisuperbiae]|uniref:carboxymuconolactone decarboxylase family protein n=1 Tax=Bradyrhizobium prioriisuperbiae TaxID=2854389 RepID=UPI0028E3DB00|nr:carboxymuconolactone decarboxylase family protein [Bradyrhizobium prioritasuperba]
MEGLRQSLPDFARDVRLNLGTLLGPGDLPGLSAGQIWGSALAAATSARNPQVVEMIESSAVAHIDPATIEAARIAAAIMAMTNIYYRAVHMADDPDLSGLPAGLRMNVLAKHGIEQGGFELFGLAASAVNGCAGCIRAHIAGARKNGIGSQAIQSTIRIAAMIHAAATALDTMSNRSSVHSNLQTPFISHPQPLSGAN